MSAEGKSEVSPPSQRTAVLGIRREDKNRWERRAPVVSISVHITAPFKEGRSKLFRIKITLHQKT